MSVAWESVTVSAAKAQHTVEGESKKKTGVIKILLGVWIAIESYEKGKMDGTKRFF